MCKRESLIAPALALTLALQLAAPALAPSPAAGAPRLAIEFLARTPHGTAACAVYDGYLGQAQAFCEASKRKRESKATVTATGKVTLCASRDPSKGHCGLGNAGVGTPTFGYGRKVTVGRFRCTVSHEGVKCVVSSSGRGFLFDPDRELRVGPAAKK